MVRLVLMAAGQATRMGRDKLALPWGNSTVLGTVLEQAVNSAVHLQQNAAVDLKVDLIVELMVIARKPIETYASDSLIRSFLELGGIWQQVSGPQPLAETIRLGLNNLSSRIKGIGFLPGDQVGVNSSELSSLITHFSATNPEILVPRAEETSGSPVFFHRKYVEDLQNLTGEQGGRIVLQHYSERQTFYPVNMEFLADLDTPEDYVRLRKSN